MTTARVSSIAAIILVICYVATDVGADGASCSGNKECYSGYCQGNSCKCYQNFRKSPNCSKKDDDKVNQNAIVEPDNGNSNSNSNYNSGSNTNSLNYNNGPGSRSIGDNNTPTSTCSPACRNGGKCISKKCSCAAGFTGKSCEKKQCANNCSGNGNCGKDGKCRCNSGWKDKDCSKAAYPPTCKPDCINGYCNSNGACVCNQGYSGLDCNHTDYNTRDLGVSCDNKKNPCSVSNSYCEYYSDQCKSGSCTCLTGYTAVLGSCVILQTVGGSCSQGQVCTRNTQCSSSGTCDCISGYQVQGPGCASLAQSKKLGENCTSNDNCLFDLICNSNKCSCPPGKVPADTDQYGQVWNCRAPKLGDRCPNGDECQGIPRASCISGSCSCQSGMTTMSYTDEYGQTQSTCASQTYLKQGSSCSWAGDGGVCETQTACVTCAGTSGSKCTYRQTPSTRPPPTTQSARIVSGSPSLLLRDTISSLASLLLIGIAAIALF